MGKGVSYLLDHGGCQPVDHTHPDFIRLDTGSVRNTVGLHSIHSPHGPSCKALDIELKDSLESTDHMWGRKYLVGQGKKHSLLNLVPTSRKNPYLSLRFLLLVSHLTVSFS